MAKESIEEILRRFEQSNPRQQTTSISSIEGKASEDSVGFTKEQLSFIQEDLTTRSVVITSSRLCNCGKIITQKTSLAGSCQNRGCKNLVCSECIRTCRCGKTFCPKHAKIYRDGEIYCSTCKPFKWLKIFFCIGNGRKEKQ